MKVSYKELEQAIGYRFKKKATLKLALTHPSYRYENPETDDDNQRMEYLGDAVLSLISAEYLFQKHPDAREGDMSKLRSQLTEDRKLAEIAASAGVGNFLLLGVGEEKSGGTERASNLADAMEALIGAAWIDGGSRAAHKIFKKLFLPEIEGIKTVPVAVNPKGSLQELAQSRGCGVPTYETVDMSGPEHDRLFTIEVTACDQTWQAQAGSKREAERLAAAKALDELGSETPQPNS